MNQGQKNYLTGTLDTISQVCFLLVSCLVIWWVISGWLEGRKIHTGYAIDGASLIFFSVLPLFVGVVLKWISGFIKAGHSPK